MKITSGRLKGKKIFFPSSAAIKPTEGIVKEAIISILRPHLSGMAFLDLFAGSGAVGLEAYSNGAEKVVFVEQDRKVVMGLKETLSRWQVPGRVFIGDYRRHLEYFHRNSLTFDVVFIDPPYQTLSYSQVIKEIKVSTLIRPRGWVIVERHYRSPALTQEELLSHGLVPYRDRKYGSVCLDVYRVGEGHE